MDGDDWFCGRAGDDWEDDCLDKEDQGAVPYLSRSDECAWYGNFCNDKLFITEIHLDDNQLTGPLPSGLYDLTELLVLDLNNIFLMERYRVTWRH